MRYLGGKTRNSKAITAILKAHRKPNQTYIEPFCGGLSVAEKMDGKMILGDYHEGLIRLYQSIQLGIFKYPTEALTVNDYKWYKENSDITDPMYTAIGFGLSYAGKWWGGYDSYYDNRGKPGETTRSLVNSLKRTFNKPHIQAATFTHQSYDEYTPTDCLIYCDPPYVNTTEYSGVDTFDHNKFWNIMRKWSKTNTVFISEFTAPDDFEEVWRKPYKIQMCKDQLEKAERLFKCS